MREYRRPERGLAVVRRDDVARAVDADQRPVVRGGDVERGIAERLTKKEEGTLGACGRRREQSLDKVGVAAHGVGARGGRADEVSRLAAVEAPRDPEMRPDRTPGSGARFSR